MPGSAGREETCENLFAAGEALTRELITRVSGQCSLLKLLQRVEYAITALKVEVERPRLLQSRGEQLAGRLSQASSTML